ncbi:MAG TPA: hypothetical protein VFY36_03605 [Solirubrobacteraceae bacterium]|nr:hypothetical protein [Solirubrobacteraceae bacterium]
MAITTSLMGGGAVLDGLIEARYAIGGIGVLVGTLALRLSVGAPSRPLRKRRLDPDAWRDADVEARNDVSAYRYYRKLRAETFSRWSRGELGPSSPAFGVTKERVLGLIINTEARRLIHACKSPVTLAIIEDTGTHFVAKRSSDDSLGARIIRGMECLHDAELDTVLDRYARYHSKAEFHVCGHTYYLVVLSNEVDLETHATARALLEGAANEYENTYQMFRWMAISAPPTKTLPQANTGQ